jgi:acyl carrier protein
LNAHLLPQVQGNGGKLEYEMVKDLRRCARGSLSASRKRSGKGRPDPDAPLSKYGLQSIHAVILAMEIEEEVGVELPPTLLWEYNTVNECAAYLTALGPAIAA